MAGIKYNSFLQTEEEYIEEKIYDINSFYIKVKNKENNEIRKLKSIQYLGCNK